MDCQICQLPKSKFFCNTCLSNHLKEYNAALSHIVSSRDTHILNASRALEHIGPRRIKRAEKARLTDKVTALRNESRRLKDECETVRSRIGIRRQAHGTRHEHLEQARLLIHNNDSINASATQQEKEQKENLEKALLSTSLSLARARAGLVNELVEVFDIAQMHQPKDKDKLHKREFTILGHVLPVPGDLTRLLNAPSTSSSTASITSLAASSFLSLSPADASPSVSPLIVNATITHILHFVQLLTFYLGVKLPFEILWSTSSANPITSTFVERGLVGVGHPYIGGGAKYTGPYPLFIPPSLSKVEREKEPLQDFPSGLTLLLYNISYLSYTQGLAPTLSGAGDVLRNVWHIIYSPELGRKSHAPCLQPLPPIVGMGFAMDIEQLMQAQAVGGKRERKDSGREKGRGSKSRGKSLEVVEEDEEWDLI